MLVANATRKPTPSSAPVFRASVEPSTSSGPARIAVAIAPRTNDGWSCTQRSSSAKTAIAERTSALRVRAPASRCAASMTSGKSRIAAVSGRSRTRASAGGDTSAVVRKSAPSCSAGSRARNDHAASVTAIPAAAASTMMSAVIAPKPHRACRRYVPTSQSHSCDRDVRPAAMKLIVSGNVRVWWRTISRPSDRCQ